MTTSASAEKLKGDVQVDETFIGPSRNGKLRSPDAEPLKRGRGTNKIPVVALVETSGNVHSRPVERVDGNTLKAAMQERIDPSARIITDELNIYPKATAGFAGGHVTVNHSEGEYVRKGDGLHTNSAESYFALLKRGIHGSFHHVSKQHLHRYCNEFSFRWNARDVDDTVRRDAAVRGAEGKRLMFHQPVGNA